MSPRPRASRQDETALRCLRAAAQLIDASLDPAGSDDPRIRSMRFPASLDWIRIEDVVRVANLRPETGISKKALNNRWGTRDAFLQDAVIYALIYADEPDIEHPSPEALLRVGEGRDFAAALAEATDHTYDLLLSHPRSFLLCQIAPYFPQHPALSDVVAMEAAADRERWARIYRQLEQRLGLDTRPDWPTARIGLALQCMLDGFVLRHRVEPGAIDGSRWQGASLFADTVLTFLLGTLDPDGSARLTRDEFTAQLGPPGDSRFVTGE